MANLPTVGSDNNVWGQELNDFLSVSHNSDGTLKGGGGGGSSFAFPWIDAPSDGTNAATAIQASLNSGPGVYYLGKTTAASYTLMHPIFLRNGVALKGRGAMQGGTTLALDSTFPHTTVSGNQTTPADSVTNFTLTVASTAKFPLGTGGVTPPGNTGVLCVNGITIYYTGTTSTTFTGCRVGDPDVNVLLDNGRAVGTFAVFLGGPGETQIGFGTRIDDIGLNCNEVPGAGGIHDSKAQEGGGGSNLLITGFRNFGVRIDQNPYQTSTDLPINHVWNKMWIIRSASDEPNSIGFDNMQWRPATGGAKYAEFRGINDISMTTKTNVACNGKAGIRWNGSPGTLLDLAIENQHAGVMVGDVYPCQAQIIGVTIASDWGSASTDAGVYVGNTVGNGVYVRNIVKLDPAGVPNRKLIYDAGTGYTSTSEEVSYERLPSGCYRVNHGGLYGTSAQRPSPTACPSELYVSTDTGHLSVSLGAAGWKLMTYDAGVSLAQDNVADGARDNSSSSTLTVTFTKTTTAGHHVILAATQSGNFVLTGVTDSRGNTWQVDMTIQSQGPTANLASCKIGTGHQIGDTLTLTFNGSSTYASAIVSEWAGLATASWADKTVTQGAAGGTTASTSASAATTVADELVFAVLAYSDAATPTAGPGYTLLTAKSSGAGVRKVAPEFTVVSSTGAQTATWLTSGFGYDAGLCTYKAAAATV